MNKNTSKNASTQLIRDAAGMTSAKMDQAPGNWIMQHAESFQVKLQETTLQASTHTHCLLCILSQKTLQCGPEKPGIEPTTFLWIESMTCSHP